MKKQLLPTLTSIGALCISCYAAFVCDKRIEADWMSVLVGVLSLLVTAVVGLNIYTLVDFNMATKEVERLKETMANDDNVSLAMSTFDTFMVYHYLLLGRDPDGIEYRFLSSGLYCIKHLSRIGEYKRCSNIAKSITGSIQSPQNIIVRKELKEELLSILVEIQKPKSIDGFHNLVEFVASIKTFG